ncbi:unknown [Sutterella sp. CAG:521]|nr:unknown [Sutterella sp. CAG:521]
MAQNEISRALEALQTIEKLSKEYEGKTERLADIANYILSRDH